MDQKRPNQLFRNKTAKIAAIPMILTALFVFVGGTIWTITYSFTKSGLLPKLKWVGFKQYDRLWGTKKWLVAIENLAIYGILMLLLVFIIGFILAALIDQKVRFENTFRTIILYPYAMSFVVTGLIWQWMLNPEFGVQSIVRDLGWESFSFDPLYNSDIAIYGVLIAGLWQGSGLVMVLMLAGLRGIDQEIWKAAKIDGIPTWKTYLMVVIPMMRPVFITTLVLVTAGIVKVYDLIVAQTSGGPGISTEVPAKYVYDAMFSGQNLGQGFAASTMMLLTVAIVVIPWAILNLGVTRSMANSSVMNVEPSGPKPKKTLSRNNIFLYGTLFVIAVYYAVPLYVMIVTSLKGMPEIRMGNLFAPPVEVTFEPWVKAWSEQCTGLKCDGLSTGFWNSVRITIPSVLVSIAIASVNGYALANWRFKGANFFFTILIFGAFIPYQVMIYPIVIMLREMGIYGTLTGLVIVHSIFGMPIITLCLETILAPCQKNCLKPHVLMVLVFGDLLQSLTSDVRTDFYCCSDLAGNWYMERLFVWRRIHGSRSLPDDRAVK